MTTQVTQDLKQAASQVRNAVQELKTYRTTLLSEQEALENRHNELLDMPLNQQDIKRAIIYTIERMADDFCNVSGYQDIFNSFIYGKTAFKYPDTDKQALTLRTFENLPNQSINELVGSQFKYYDFTGQQKGIPLIFFISFLLKDTLIQKVEQLYDTMTPSLLSKPLEYPSIEERKQEIATINERLKAIQLEMTHVMQNLRELGVTAY